MYIKDNIYLMEYYKAIKNNYKRLPAIGKCLWSSAKLKKNTKLNVLRLPIKRKKTEYMEMMFG